MIYQNPIDTDSSIKLKSTYDNYINGEWVKPGGGEYFKNSSPVNGGVYCEVARSNKEDIELALDAAHNAKAKWAATSVAERSNILLRIADRLEKHLEELAVVETWDNGKPIMETLNADLPAAIDQFRYFAGALLRNSMELNQEVTIWSATSVNHHSLMPKPRTKQLTGRAWHA